MIALSVAWAVDTSGSAGGGGVATDAGAIGLNGRAYLNLGERVCLGPEITVFAPTTRQGERRSRLDFSVNAHYIFELRPWLGAYPVAGIGLGLEGEESGLRALPNARVGAGFHATYRRLSPFIEGQIIFSEKLEGAGVLGALLHFGSRGGDPDEER